MKYLYRWVCEAEVMPKWMGVAYNDLLARRVMAVILPFNLIVRWFEDIYWRVRLKKKESLKDKIWVDAYDQGWSSGSLLRKKKCPHCDGDL